MVRIMRKEVKDQIEAFLNEEGIEPRCDDCHSGIIGTSLTQLFQMEFIAGGNRMICKDCLAKNKFKLKSLTLFWLYQYQFQASKKFEVQEFVFFDSNEVQKSTIARAIETMRKFEEI